MLLSLCWFETNLHPIDNIFNCMLISKATGWAYATLLSYENKPSFLTTILVPCGIFPLVSNIAYAHLWL